MTENNTITVTDCLPMLIVDRSSSMELDCSLCFQATAQWILETDEGNHTLFPAPSEEVIQKKIASTVVVAYISRYPQGMPKESVDVGHPETDFIEQIRAQISEIMLRMYGVKLLSFNIEYHRLAESDQLLWNRMQEMKRLSDPESVAENFRKETQKILDGAFNVKSETWICTCGAVNKGNYCTECGKKRVVSNNEI